MRKILSLLVLIAYALVVQMSFIHALDMGMEREVSIGSQNHASFCNATDASHTNTCVNEIPESKWIEGVKKFEILLFTLVSFFSFFTAFALNPLRIDVDRFFKRIIVYYDTLYLGLYGIIRNIS